MLGPWFLARSYGISRYDAAYLDLAVRESLTLASLDRTLVKAAEKAGVSIYLKEREGQVRYLSGSFPSAKPKAARKLIYFSRLR